MVEIVAVIWSSAGEDADSEAEEEAADVRPPGDAAEALAARAQTDGAIEELQEKPPAEKNHGRRKTRTLAAMMASVTAGKREEGMSSRRGSMGVVKRDA